jgi:NADH-quinone oxidoreductase subunit G
MGFDPREELPILHLRIRKAARKGGARVFVVHPRRTPLDLAEHLFVAPGREAETVEELRSGSDGPLGEAARTVREAGGDAVVLAGPRLAESPGGALTGLASLAKEAGARFAYLPRRANDRGALRSGVHPSLLPGGRRVDDDAERAEVEEVWGPVPSEAGRSTSQMLEACARRDIEVLFLVGADPLVDFPDAELARRALENVPFKIIVDISLGEYASFADAVLPAAAFLEKAGHFTDWEVRGQRFYPVRDPVGLARPEWQIFQELAEAMGGDLGLGSLEAIHREMGRLLTPRDIGPALGGPSPQELPPSPEGLTLFTYPLLVDDGRLSASARELKEALHREPFVELHPVDAERLGLSEGGRARVRTERGEAELPVVVTEGIFPGAVFVPFNQAGLRANRLLAGSPRSAVELEAVAEEAAEAAG